MQTFNLILLAIFAVAIIFGSHWLGQQAYNWLPTPATAEADYVGHLFSFLVTLGSFVFLGVFGMLIYSILFYRVGNRDTSDAPPIRGNLKIEATWTLIPFILVVWIASYSFSIYQRMSLLGSLPSVHLHPLEAPAHAQSSPTDGQPEEKIEVVAKQWSWTFRYLDRNVISHELHLPIDRRAHLLLQSEDVLHGFYVPNFRIKQDIVPNRTIDFRFNPNRVGKYTLYDSQFSGTYFAVNTANVYVDTPEAYQQWLAGAAARPILPPAPANVEHNQPPAIPLRSNWPTIQPRNFP
ncbi:cytochrome c oxidase subunit II [Chroococcus sp. FPU101]|uniref:cytochrome c oxidase subunit II n=1 Tax=Chroococcus sp. FPU101 TaxID=1974212 RepID=UPI001A90C66C|nr:cytochrome c oxidase subunit II [Chroococcus sp. FPU101]GFE71417.1 cytochrome c oxidase, subunit II [Chroococcus sp. FPU101]